MSTPLLDIRSELDLLKNLQKDSNDNYNQRIEDLINKLKENSTNQHSFDDEVKNLKEALDHLNRLVKEIGERQADFMRSTENKEASGEKSDAPKEIQVCISPFAEIRSELLLHTF